MCGPLECDEAGAGAISLYGSTTPRQNECPLLPMQSPYRKKAKDHKNNPRSSTSPTTTTETSNIRKCRQRQSARMRMSTVQRRQGPVATKARQLATAAAGASSGRTFAVRLALASVHEDVLFPRVAVVVAEHHQLSVVHEAAHHHLGVVDGGVQLLAGVRPHPAHSATTTPSARTPSAKLPRMKRKAHSERGCTSRGICSRVSLPSPGGW